MKDNYAGTLYRYVETSELFGVFTHINSYFSGKNCNSNPVLPEETGFCSPSKIIYCNTQEEINSAIITFEPRKNTSLFIITKLETFEQLEKESY